MEKLIKDQFEKHYNTLKALQDSVVKTLQIVEEKRSGIVTLKENNKDLKVEDVKETLKNIQELSFKVGLKRQDIQITSMLTLEYFGLAQEKKIDLGIDENEAKSLETLRDQMKALFSLDADGNVEIKDKMLYSQVVDGYMEKAFSDEELEHLFNSPHFNPVK